MELITDTLKERIIYCRKRFKKIKDNLKNNKHFVGLNDICVYATGSYAREEAWEKSDLDLFFINTDKNNVPLSKLTKILVDAELIKLNNKLLLPEFSNDGQFLEIHLLKDIIDIGSQEEDYKNFFTARMLFLLESKPLFNKTTYDKVLDRVIDAYFRDFNKHEKDFIPVFLVNDILRYWKTLCLNYEHKRNRGKRSEREKKLKAHKNNLKLKFSRKLTCYSFLIMIISYYVKPNFTFNKKIIKEIVNKTPVERLLFVANNSNDNIKANIHKSLVIYSEFLNFVNKPDEWLLNKRNRDSAFEKSRKFGDLIYTILNDLSKFNNSDILKYFVS